MVNALKKLKLRGFNNLTKSLSFNMYDVCFALTPEQRQEYIDEEYNAERLTQILTDVAHLIGASILNVAHQDTTTPRAARGGQEPEPDRDNPRLRASSLPR